MENVQYAPTRGRFKIYLIDEVHMLSGHSFNALLKTLEEPPEHVKFLLATTDPQKLPITILSRCLQFTLRHISVEQITLQLQKILEKEQITADVQALVQLADAADGSMRDALSLLDQGIAFSGGKLTESSVNQMLGTVPSEQVDALVRSLCESDTAQAMEIIQSLSTLNIDFGKLIDQLSTIFHSAAIAQAVPEYLQHIAQFENTVKRVSSELASEDLQLFYQVLLNSRKDLYLAHSPRAGFEMTVLRMILFRPLEHGKAPHARSVATSRQKVKQVADAGDGNAVSVAVPRDNEKCDNWQSMINQMQLSGVTRALATHCSLKQHEKNSIQLELTKEHESLMAESSVEKLTHGLKGLYGQDVIVTINITGESVDSPAQRELDTKAEQLTAAEDSLQEDSFVQTLKQGLQAEIIPGTIQPIDK